MRGSVRCCAGICMGLCRGFLVQSEGFIRDLCVAGVRTGGVCTRFCVGLYKGLCRGCPGKYKGLSGQVQGDLKSGAKGWGVDLGGRRRSEKKKSKGVCARV